MKKFTILSTLAILTMALICMPNGRAANSDQTLYFQNADTVIINGSYGLHFANVMNTTIPSGNGTNNGDVCFYSWPLSTEFTFSVVNVTVYYLSGADNNPANGQFALNAHIVEVNEDFSQIGPQLNNSKIMNFGPPVGSLTINVNRVFQKNERMFLEVYTSATSNTKGILTPLILSGWHDYPSNISYSNNATFIPEYSTAFIPLALIVTTIVTTLLNRRLRPPRIHL